MTQTDAVGRRLVEGIYKRDLDSVVSRGMMSRETAVDCLLAADGDLARANQLWTLWRQSHPDPARMQRIAGQAELEAELVAYVRDHATGAKAETP